MASLKKRPERLRLADFAGRMSTFSPEPANWHILNPQINASQILLLGLGPGASWEWLPHNCGYWIDSPQILSQTSASPPPHFQEITPDVALTLADQCKIYFYRPNLRIAPDFWNPLLARLEWVANPEPLPKAPMIWLPGHEHMLLHQELKRAFAELGYANICCGMDSANLPSLVESWAHSRPELALSINFRGLDPNGRIFELCREGDIPLAIWLVDNPWHILSGIPLPWWKEANLFISDSTFIPTLKEYGAKNVWYMPLAASPHMFRSPRVPELGPLFVGRASFPAREKFFSGLAIPPHLLEQSLEITDESHLPDFHWWEQQLKLPLWPGKAGRTVGYGADICSRSRRSHWLANTNNLHIIGDASWSQLLPNIQISPPVDYYGSLPELYNNSLCCLQVTSLLLPGSLSQRHFDVWAAGGFLFTDNTPGLQLFPQCLTKAIKVEHPEDLNKKIEQLKANLTQRTEISQEWQELIGQKHTYTARIKQIQQHIL